MSLLAYIFVDKLICLFSQVEMSLLTSWYVSFHKLICLFWQVDMSLFTSWYVSFDKLICLFSQVDMSLFTSWYVSFHKVICLFLHIQPIPLGVTFSNAVFKTQYQSSNVSFHWNVVKEWFELWAYENVTPIGIGCKYSRGGGCFLQSKPHNSLWRYNWTTVSAA